MIFIRDNQGCLINCANYVLSWIMTNALHEQIGRALSISHLLFTSTKVYKGKVTKASNITISKHFEILGVM